MSGNKFKYTKYIFFKTNTKLTLMIKILFDFYLTETSGITERLLRIMLLIEDKNG